MPGDAARLMICPKCRARHRVAAGARLVCDACGYGKGLIQERIRHGLAPLERKRAAGQQAEGPFSPAINPRALVPRTWRSLVFRIFFAGFPLLFFVAWLGGATLEWLFTQDAEGFTRIQPVSVLGLALGMWLASVYLAVSMRDYTTALYYAGSSASLVGWLEERLTAKGFQAEESDGARRVYRTPWYGQFGVGVHRAIVADREGVVELTGPRSAIHAVLRGAEFE